MTEELSKSSGGVAGGNTARNPIDAEGLRDALVWVMGELRDCGSVDDNGIPDHDCEFISNPEKGACDFHEKWVEAEELVQIDVADLPWTADMADCDECLGTGCNACKGTGRAATTLPNVTPCLECGVPTASRFCLRCNAEKLS